LAVRVGIVPKTSPKFHLTRPRSASRSTFSPRQLNSHLASHVTVSSDDTCSSKPSKTCGALAACTVLRQYTTSTALLSPVRMCSHERLHSSTVKRRCRAGPNAYCASTVARAPTQTQTQGCSTTLACVVVCSHARRFYS
jgi:hypothetical protein